MKYFVRSIKYFIYLMIILALLIVILILTGFVEGNLEDMFVNGTDSLWQIALLMAVFAAIYPRFGYSTRTAHLKGSAEELRPTINKVMELHDYKLESETADGMTFRRRSPVAKAMKMWEDRLSLKYVLGGVEVEGLTKDMVRIISGLEATQQEEDV